MMAANLPIHTALAYSTAQSTNLVSLFGPSLSPDAQVILPGNSSWSTELQSRWSDYQAPTYIGAIKPATEQDIEITVQIAQAYNISFLATGGGHGFSDYSAFTGGISIDLGNFHSAELNKKENLLTVGGATNYSEITDLLYDAGKELPLASCACSGVVGATLGAGLGPLQGLRGLMIDALESVRMVTADGKLITVSETEHPDLFWGLRGAGSNFGIVTSATYKVYDITNRGQTYVAALTFPANVSKEYWKVLKALDDTLPPQLALTSLGYHNATTNQSLIALNALYFGPQSEGETYIAPFLALNPISAIIEMAPQNILYPDILGSCDPNQHINIYTSALLHTDTNTFESAYQDFQSFWHQYPGYQGRLLVQRFPNQAVTRVPGNRTAYPWRGAKTHVSIEGYMTATNIYPQVDAFERNLRDRFAATSGYGQLAAYTNFARGTEGPVAWYSREKLGRLRALKGIWDRKGLFRFNKPVW